MDGIINELYEGLGSEMLATLPKLVPLIRIEPWTAPMILPKARLFKGPTLTLKAFTGDTNAKGLSPQPNSMQVSIVRSDNHNRK